MTTLHKMTGISPDCRSTVPSSELVSDDMVGVEVELEAIPVDFRHEQRLNFWDMVEDGSLRDNGVEFVFKQPLCGVDVVGALKELETKLTEHKIKPITSERTSVHVHLDVRDLDLEQYRKLILLYILFEKSLFRYCGNERADNIFCLSFENSQENLYGLRHLFDKDLDMDEYRFNQLVGNLSKYSAINLLSTGNFGSLEFRGHVGEWRFEPLLEWVNILQSLKVASRTFDVDLEDILLYTSEHGVEHLFDRVFGNYSGLLFNEHSHQDIFDGVHLAQDVLYSKALSSEDGEGLSRNSLMFKFLDKIDPERSELQKARIPKDKGFKNTTPTKKPRMDHYMPPAPPQPMTAEMRLRRQAEHERLMGILDRAGRAHADMAINIGDDD